MEGFPLTRRYRLQRAIKKMSGLVAYYPLGEVQGSIAKNNAPGTKGSIDGSIVSGTLGQPGKAGKAISFNGSSDVVNLPSGSGLPLYAGGIFSIFAIVNVADISSKRTIYSEGSSSSSGPFYQLVIDTNGKIKITVQTDAFAAIKDNVYTNTVLSTNTYYAIGLTDNNGTVREYINGAQDTQTGMSYTRGTLTLNQAAIGALRKNTTAQYFNGKIQHVALFNRALTAAEMKKLSRVAGLSS